MDRDELSRLRELEEENRRLKRIVAQQALDIDGLKDLLSKKW
jgi:putative transposase